MSKNSGYAVKFAEEQLSDGTIVVEAWHPDLPGCRSHGSTRDEALENLEDARQLYLATVRSSQGDGEAKVTRAV
jgi:predicted RNase H-like HicB family nuclease